LRDLLKFEFFFLPKERFLDDLERELEIIAPRGLEGRSARAILDAAPMLLADRVLRSSIEAQLVVAQLLARKESRGPVHRDAFLAECLGLGRHLLLRGRISSPDSVSRELYAGALKLAENRGLSDPDGVDVMARRRAWLQQLQWLGGRLDAIAELDDCKLEGVLDVAA
jgi:glycerol-3-phosphate O-acyltransferase